MNRVLISPIAVVALLVALCVSQHAVAQGTFGSLPDPVSSRDLERYAQRLSLSEQQLLALTPHHRHYLSQFSELRNSDIERWLQSVQEIGDDFDFTKRREVEQAVRTLKLLMSRVRRLDEQFFNDMQELLTEEQQAMLPRVRLARERERYSTEMTRGINFLNPGVRIDLSVVVYELELSHEVMELADPILASYERQLTHGAREMFNSGLEMVLEVLKEFEQRGFTDGRPSDPEVAMAMFEAFQEIWPEVMGDLLDQGEDLAKLNRTTYRRLASVLPHSDMQELRIRYFRQAYPEAARIGLQPKREFDAALSLEGLPSQLREDIEALARSHWDNQSRIASEIADLLDARRAELDLGTMIGRDEDEREDAIDELRSRARAADSEVLETLKELLGEEWSEKLANARSAEDATPSRSAIPSQQDNNDGRERVLGRVPLRISPRDLERIAAMLELSDGQMMVLESVHAEYLETFSAISEEQMQPLQAAARKVAAGELEIDRSSSLYAEQIDALFRMQHRVVDAVREADEAFFDDVAVAVGSSDDEKHIQRLRLQREAEVYRDMQQNTFGTMYMGGRQGEAEIDLSELLREHNLDRDFDDAALNIVLDYEQQASQVLRDLYDARMDLHRIMQTRQARSGSGGFRSSWREIAERAEEAGQTMRELNLTTVEKLQHALPSQRGRMLQHQFRLAAYPSVYDDPTSAEDMLTAAISLPDLAGSQRARLRELAMEYRSGYGQLCQQMFRVHESMPDGGDRSGIETENELEKLRFERDELNQQARRELRAILNSEQLVQIDG